MHADGSPAKLRVLLLLQLTAAADASNFLTGERTIFWRTLDVPKAVLEVGRVPRLFARWGAAEWGEFRLSPARMSVRTSDGGACIIYYAPDSLREVGGVEFAAVDACRGLLQPTPAPAIRMRPLPGSASMRAHEAVPCCASNARPVALM